VGYRHIDDAQDGVFVADLVPLVTGSYHQFINHEKGWTQTSQDGYAYLDAKFHTGQVAHVITGGFGAFTDTAYGPVDYSIKTYVSGFSLTNRFGTPAAQALAYAAATNKPGLAHKIDFGDYREYSRAVGDQIAFSKSWLAMVGVNYGEIEQIAYITTGATAGTQSAIYQKSQLSPSASIMYKPIPILSTFTRASNSIWTVRSPAT
jgi:iron complex outermembrane receptor protein